MPQPCIALIDVLLVPILLMVFMHLLLFLEIIQSPTVEKKELQFQAAQDSALARVIVFHRVTQLPLNVATKLSLQHYSKIVGRKLSILQGSKSVCQNAWVMRSGSCSALQQTKSGLLNSGLGSQAAGIEANLVAELSVFGEQMPVLFCEKQRRLVVDIAQACQLDAEEGGGVNAFWRDA